MISSAKLYIAVADEKRELEHTLQGMLSGVLVVDGDGRVRLMNSAARHIFGVAGEDGTGKPLTQVIHNEEIHDLVHSCLSGRSEANAELSIYLPEERIYQVQTALLRGEDNDVSGVVATFNDITELRSVERMKSEFVSTVSHELRTPLTSIKGFIRTLIDDTEGYYDREMQMEFYRIIDTECDRLVRLISDLLNLSRIESGRSLDLVLAEVDLGEDHRSGGGERSAPTPPTTSSTSSSADDLPRITADQDKVEQMLTNLLSNAVKYSPDGGKITVHAAVHGGRHVAVSVADQGIGIPGGPPRQALHPLPPGRHPGHTEAVRHRHRALPGQAPGGGAPGRDHGREHAGRGLDLHLRAADPPLRGRRAEGSRRQVVIFGPSGGLNLDACHRRSRLRQGVTPGPWSILQ